MKDKVKVGNQYYNNVNNTIKGFDKILEKLDETVCDNPDV